MMDKKQWKGVVALVADAVAGGASSVERVHRAISTKFFDFLEQLPIVSAPSCVVRVAHDLCEHSRHYAMRLPQLPTSTSLDLICPQHNTAISGLSRQAALGRQTLAKCCKFRHIRTSDIPSVCKQAPL